MIGKQLKLSNADEKLILNELIRSVNEEDKRIGYRNKHFLKLSENREKNGKPYIKYLSRVDISKALHTLEVSLLVEKEDEILYKISHELIKYLKGWY